MLRIIRYTIKKNIFYNVMARSANVMKVLLNTFASKKKRFLVLLLN